LTWRPDGFEGVVLAALFALSVALLGGLLAKVWTDGGVLSGSDGLLVVDPLQYLNWLRQSAEHGAAANLYDGRSGPHSFVHPGLLLAGGLHALGLGVAASYLAFKPLAVLALFAGALLYVRRFLRRRDDRHLALLLGLLAAVPTAAIVGWTGAGGSRAQFEFDLVVYELWNGSSLWGYLFTAVAIGLLPLGLLAYEHGRRDGAVRWLAAAGACGLLCAWLQPWQGATFALVLLATEAVLSVLGRRGPRLRWVVGLVAVLAATAAPLVYYLLLSKLDPSWELAGQVNRADVFGGRAWGAVVLGLAPLTVPAALAYRRVPRDFGHVALRVWPLAGLLVFAAPAGTFPFHALQGLTLPLVVLGVLAWRRLLRDRPLPLPWAVAVAVVLIVPGTAYRLEQARDQIAEGRQPHVLKNGERDALAALDHDTRSGTVLAPAYLGPLVPAYTGRETWVGAGSWTPDLARRTAEAEALFSGRLAPDRARALIRRSGARFLLADCQGRADLRRLGLPARRYGCATVYRVPA